MFITAEPQRSKVQCVLKLCFARFCTRLERDGYGCMACTRLARAVPAPHRGLFEIEAVDEKIEGNECKQGVLQPWRLVEFAQHDVELCPL